MRSARPGRPRPSIWTVVMAAVVAAGIAAIGAGLALSTAYDRRIAQLAQEAATLKEEAERQQSLMALLRDPATQVVTLTGLEPAPNATAKLFWHATGGGLLVAQGLPPAPWGRAYALWAMTGQQAPMPAGIFTVDGRGVGSLRVAPMAAGVAVHGFSVTLEPAGSVPAPTGTTYLAGAL